MSRMTPSPPGYFPFPPEPGRNENSLRITGYRLSRTTVRAVELESYSRHR